MHAPAYVTRAVPVDLGLLLLCIALRAGTVLRPAAVFITGTQLLILSATARRVRDTHHAQ